jgi:pimeloyl-ACP methyl ester carboxylesterase
MEMTLFAQRRGGGAEAVVFLHGFGSSHEVWHRVIANLAQAPHVIAYDLPGHAGSSDFPDAGPPKRAATAILEDLAAYGVARAHFVGHSMGGAVAALCALLDPARAARLTLMAPGGFGPEINHRLLTRYAAATTGETLAPCLEAMFGYLAPVPDGAIASALRTRERPGQSATLQRIAAGLARDGRQGTLPLDALAALDLPVTVAWGELDAVLPCRHSLAMPARFESRLFPNLGHMLPEEAPEAMAAIVREGVAP